MTEGFRKNLKNRETEIIRVSTVTLQQLSQEFITTVTSPSVVTPSAPKAINTLRPSNVLFTIRLGKDQVNPSDRFERSFPISMGFSVGVKIFQL